MVSFSQPNGLGVLPNLARLQDLQAEIFRQLQLLLPDDIAYHDQLQSRVAGSPLLRLLVLERHHYTSFFRLTYEFPAVGDKNFAPDAHIRFYHDARLAEVTSFNCRQACRRDQHPAYPTRQLLQRTWRQNRALDRWLEHLLCQGHSAETLLPAQLTVTAAAPTPLPVTVG